MFFQIILAFNMCFPTIYAMCLQDHTEVEVNYPPVLSQPPDIAFAAGTTGHSITWVPSDNITFLPRYSIDVDGAYNDSGANHVSGGPIVFIVDNLAVGTHNVKCIYWDGCGLSTQSTVWVTVTPAGQGGPGNGGSGGNSGKNIENNNNNETNLPAITPINVPIVLVITIGYATGGVIIGFYFRAKTRHRNFNSPN